MRRLATAQRGFTLVEVMIVSTLFLMILGATLTSTGNFNRLNVQNQKLNDQTDRARRGVDRAVRQLRNLARRIEAPVIARATATDFIFQTSDPDRTWVRYCLQTRPDGKVWLWSASSSSAVSADMSGPCPGNGWTDRNAFVTNVTNNALGRSLPLFTYTCVDTAPAGCPATSVDFSRIRSVGMDLFLDDNLSLDPPEVRVSSAIFLRNQNEEPAGCYTERPITTRQVLLNASCSVDPEGRNLRLLWFRGAAPAFTCDNPPQTSPLLWTGITLNHTFPVSDGPSGTKVPMTLVACDPGGLQARHTTQVTIP